MKKYKICIVGDGLSGLITALTLSKLNIEIDLVSKKQKQEIKDNRTTAISPTNFKFISKFLSKSQYNFFYKCKKVSLYHENDRNRLINFMNFENSNKNLMYIFENKKLKKILLSYIKKSKQIKIIREDVKKISADETSVQIKNKKKFYEMILLCTGRGSKINENIFGKRSIKNDKNEVAFTSIINHDLGKINPKQYFMKEGPLAILPINDKKFSLIWSMSDKYSKLQKNEFKDLILRKLKNIFTDKARLRLSDIKSFPIYFQFNKSFYKKNISAIGESAYNVYPVAGQGFNLVLRDIESLYKKIKENISLGLQIKDSIILKDLFAARKPENFILGLGINLTQSFFRYNKFTEPLKNSFLKDLDRYTFFKKIGLKFTDKGIFN